MVVAAAVRRTEVVAVALIVAVAAIVVPAVAAPIAHVEMWGAEVEVVTARIAGIDAEMPEAGVPVERTVEIGGGTEGIPLPRIEYIAQVQVAALPVGAEHITAARDAHQVVQVDFVGCLILRVSQVQLVCHLVGEEQGLLACLLVAHRVCTGCYRQHGKQGHHKLLHSRMFF